VSLQATATENTVDREGRLVSCEHRGRRITRTEHDGRVVALATHFDNKRFNSPNDIVVKSDGSVWFTDPAYGIDSEYEGDAAPSEIGQANVYCHDPRTGTLTAVVTDRVQPNGLAFSPDERVLYVSDQGPNHVAGYPHVIAAYDVRPDNTIANIFVTAQDGFYDGFRCDTQGNVWTSASGGVRCYAPDGMHIGTIPIPEIVSKICFGGCKRNRLLITRRPRSTPFMSWHRARCDRSCECIPERSVGHGLSKSPRYDRIGRGHYRRLARHRLRVGCCARRMRGEGHPRQSRPECVGRRGQTSDGNRS
jgi:sugar lactone lactonase YvrE